MSNLDEVVNTLGVLWFVLWAAVFVSLRQLHQLLREIDRPQWERLQVEQGTLDPREPFRAYMRLRRFVGDEDVRRAYAGRVGVIMRRLAWVLTGVEILTAILVPLTLFAGLRAPLGLTG